MKKKKNKEKKNDLDRSEWMEVELDVRMLTMNGNTMIWHKPGKNVLFSILKLNLLLHNNSFIVMIIIEGAWPKDDGAGCR